MGPIGPSGPFSSRKACARHLSSRMGFGSRNPLKKQSACMSLPARIGRSASRQRYPKGDEIVERDPSPRHEVQAVVGDREQDSHDRDGRGSAHHEPRLQRAMPSAPGTRREDRSREKRVHAQPPRRPWRQRMTQRDRRSDKCGSGQGSPDRGIGRRAAHWEHHPARRTW